MRLIIKFLVFIMSNDSPKQMGWAVAIALLFSLMPGFNLLHLFLLFVVFLLQIHIPSFFLFSIVFKLFNHQSLLLVHYVGDFLLRLEGLYNFWTKLYNLPLVPFTKFYNTSVLGGFFVGVLLLYPIQFFCVKTILFYRKNYQVKVNKFLEKSKVVKILKTSKLYKLYVKYNEIRKIF